MTKILNAILWGFAITNGLIMLMLFWGMRLGEVCVLEPNQAILITETSFCLVSVIFLVSLAYKDMRAVEEVKGE